MIITLKKKKKHKYNDLKSFRNYFVTPGVTLVIKDTGSNFYVLVESST